jgi:5-methylcytosine-specific restriction protein A
MPDKPLKICCWRGGCSTYTRDRFCEAHGKQHTRNQDVQRGTAQQRGYTYEWQKKSKAFIARPEHAVCEIVGRHGDGLACRYPSTTVDHIIPVEPNDARFMDEANWQGACHDCNSWKSGRIIPVCF